MRAVWVGSGWTGAAFRAAFGWGFGVGLGSWGLGSVGLARGPRGFWPRSIGLVYSMNTLLIAFLHSLRGC